MGENGDVRIPGFTIQRELGRGAMGVVYLAHEEALGRDVALKVLKPGFGEGQEVRQRFDREVRATARLKHPNIVPILSTGEAQGRRWFAMQYVPGDTLEEVLNKARHGTIGVARAARIVREVALALYAAHEAGVTHRDVKPGNVMLRTESAPEAERTGSTRRMRRSWLRRSSDTDGMPIVDRPLLADFGLAADRTASKLSESGMLIGTPGYMAPEQYQGRADEVGPHSDQWALGVLLYECITGHMPFPTTDLATLARMIGHDEPIAPSRLDPRIDRDLETICLKALSKSPRERYANTRLMAEDLGHWLREEPIGARPPGPLRRLSAWTRRKPARATALGALLVAGIILAIVNVGVRLSRATRTGELEASAQEHMDRGEFGLAEQMYDEWIALDPVDGRPRDLRDSARARRGVTAASKVLTDAEAAIDRLNQGRDRLARLEARARHGAEALGGAGLGTESARGSEPWSMRQSAYAASREIESVKAELARLLADVGSKLAIARSLAEAHAPEAGEDGRLLLAMIERRAATWHMGEWRLAVAARDAERKELHEQAVKQLDRRTRAFAAELSGVRRLQLVTGPEPAQAWLFRYEREVELLAGGGPRLLPVPYHPERGKGALGPAYAAAVAARLAGADHRAVQTDVPRLAKPLVSTATHVGTLDGAMRRERYAARLGGSAYPLDTSEANALGVLTAESHLDLGPGRYMLLLRRRGRPDLLLPFEVGRVEPAPLVVPDDLALARVPDGFVLVPGGDVLLGSDDEDAPHALPRQRVPVRTFLAARFELTYADWWEFLDDERTLDAIATAVEQKRGLRFVPRSRRAEPDADAYAAALPSRLPGSRRFRPMDSPEHAATHVSLYDIVGHLTPPDGEDQPHDYQYEELAEALRASSTVGWSYLQWRTERSRERARRATAGGPVLPDVAVVREQDGSLGYRALRFTLPTQPEWERMARGGDDRVFVYGDEREWLHFKGTRSRAFYPAPEAVGLFADDESVFGVRDLTGSVAEWTADWDAEGRVFWVKGHSWGSQRPEDDRIAARRTLAPPAVSSTVGVRLVVRVLETVDDR